jgi:hypothetical protein
MTYDSNSSIPGARSIDCLIIYRAQVILCSGKSIALAHESSSKPLLHAFTIIRASTLGSCMFVQLSVCSSSRQFVRRGILKHVRETPHPALNAVDVTLSSSYVDFLCDPQIGPSSFPFERLTFNGWSTEADIIIDRRSCGWTGGGSHSLRLRISLRRSTVVVGSKHHRRTS